jgi:hypothetical protein
VIGDLGWAHDAGVEARGAERCGTDAAWRDDASAGCATMPTMAADREESGGKSQPRYLRMGCAPKSARRFSSLTACQTAMTIALLCRGPSAALFTVRRI